MRLFCIDLQDATKRWYTVTEDGLAYKGEPVLSREEFAALRALLLKLGICHDD